MHIRVRKRWSESRIDMVDSQIELDSEWSEGIIEYEFATYLCEDFWSIGGLISKRSNNQCDKQGCLKK